MDNPYITSELIKQINHMRRRQRLRMYLTQIVIILITWLIFQFFYNLPNYQSQQINQDKTINNNIEKMQQFQGSQTDLHINKVNKLSDIADI